MVGAFASPCEGKVERPDTVVASSCSRRFRAAPLLDRAMGVTAGTFRFGRVVSVVLGGNQEKSPTPPREKNSILPQPAKASPPRKEGLPLCGRKDGRKSIVLPTRKASLFGMGQFTNQREPVWAGKTNLPRVGHPIVSRIRLEAQV